MAIILIVDDDEALRDALREVVVGFGHDVSVAESGAAALRILEKSEVDAALIDLRMPGMDGLELLTRMRESGFSIPVAVLTAHATAQNTIEAMRLGAFDHLTKPIGRDDVQRNIAAMLACKPDGNGNPLTLLDEGLVGSSEAIRGVQKAIGRLADSDATVLITGETGTGKELVARAIHEHGVRAKQAFVAVNCAAVPIELIETELFGHVKGAFSGAVQNREGAFRHAQGGTLFLDEIGDMEPTMQAKILRALQERVVTPVGGSACDVDVRVVAATHRDLSQRVSEGLFRHDLFYRLNVVPIHLPALRERLSDVVPLAEYFLSRAGGKKQLTADAAARLIRYGWPGNVRELRNLMERMQVTVQGAFIHAQNLSLADDDSVEAAKIDWPDEDLPQATLRLEELLIRRALAKCRGNRSEAARLLNIHRQLLYAKMKRLDIEVSDIETPGVGKADE